MTDYYGYTPSEYPDTEEKVFGMEKYEAEVLIDLYKDYTDGIMHFLEIVWERGHRAATAGIPVEFNPYIHPEARVDIAQEKA